MELIAGLLPLLLIAAAIRWLLNLRGLGPLRRAMDVFANGSVTNLNHAKRFSDIGESVPFEAQGGTNRHETTVGLRILATFLMVTLLGILATGGPTQPLLGRGMESFLVFAGAVLLAGYYLIYIWTYRLTLSDSELVIPTWGLGEKRFDLARLDSVEDDGAYCLRLYFDDGRRAEILKYVTGRRTMLTRLENRVKRNAP